MLEQDIDVLKMLSKEAEEFYKTDIEFKRLQIEASVGKAGLFG